MHVEVICLRYMHAIINVYVLKVISGDHLCTYACYRTMPVASAPPYRDGVMVQQIGPTRSGVNDSPPTYEDSANPNSKLIFILIKAVCLVC